MNIKTTMLKIVTIIIDLFILLFGFMLTMGLTSSIRENSFVPFQLLTIITLYLSCAIVLGISFYLFRIFNLIDIHTFFSQKALTSVRKIRYLFIIEFLILLGNLPFIYYQADHGDAPGLIFVALAFNFIPLALTAFISAMEKILINSIKFKQENDLTI